MWQVPVAAIALALTSTGSVWAAFSPATHSLELTSMLHRSKHGPISRSQPKGT